MDLLLQLQREFRAFRQHAEDRIKTLERNLRLESPAPVVVPVEPETPAALAAPAAPAAVDAKAAKGKAADAPADQTDPAKQGE